ncbi:molybdate ABC transporter permease subunit [Trueperella pecoris]|nr:molybdate ABC transporter permease subunit [Trueperella pecoris]
MMELRGIPRGFWLPAVVAVAVLLLPLVGMASRVPWGDLWPILTSEESADALFLSLWTCLISTVVCLVIGTPLALVLARAAELPRRPRWLTVLRAFVLVPLVMPPVVAGLALLTTFGRRGVLGPALGVLGIEIPFTTFAVIVAQVFVSLPFLVMTVEAAAKAAGSGFEHAARGLGASRWVQFSRITLPLLGPSIGSGAALACARSLGEFGATITFAGSMQGTTRTLPLDVYLRREQDPDSALALSVVLILLALCLTAVTTVVEAFNSRRFHDAVGAPHAESDAVSPGGPKPGGLASDGTAQAPAVGFTLDADVPERGVYYRLEGRPGETVALIGPNGSGKSTGIRLLAGDISSPHSRVDVPPTIGFLDQSPALFPHMSVLDNVAFGPRCAGVSKAAARERARAELIGVGLEGVADKAPWQLSGGQAQRVALARVLALDPQLLLLDEPFAALDSTSSASLRAVLARRTRGLTTVLVSHDVIDVLTLADRVAVLEAGRVVAVSPTAEALASPATGFVAAFAGLNMQFGCMGCDGLVLDGTGQVVRGLVEGVCAGDRGAAVFDPLAVSLRRGLSEGSPRNVFEAQVVGVRASAAGVDVTLDIGTSTPLHSTITAGAAAEIGVEIGVWLLAEVKAVQVRLISSSV